MTVQTQTSVGGLPTNVPYDILVAFINRLLLGKLNCTGDVTLTSNATSTTLTDHRIGPRSYIDFMPQSSVAATAKQNVYVTGRQKGQATINHGTASATTVFTYVIVG